MAATHIVVEATLNPDGTLVPDSKLPLPAGRVQLIVQPLPELPAGDPFWQQMRQIWEGQKARRQIPRGKKEIDAEIKSMRDEAEDEMRAIERLQDECRQTREGGASP